MTQPETCGAAGGAVSMWVKISKCQNLGGIISTRGYNENGLIIYCSQDTIKYKYFYL